MSSLRSMICDGRYALGWDGESGYTEEMERVLNQSIDIQADTLKKGSTLLVNTQRVIEALNDQLEVEDVVYFDAIPCPKPPFHWMWLEGKWGCNCHQSPTHKQGALVARYDGGPALERWLEETPRRGESWMGGRVLKDKPDSFMQASLWQEDNGYAVHYGRIYWWLDKAGNYQDAAYFPVKEKFDLEFAWLLHSFARMNCHNVKLIPQTAGGPRIKKGKPHPAYSYWHEIVVTNLPELRRQQKGELAPDGEKRELRFHKIRGHYADYTQGKGLFGKWKIRIWVEEHSAGNRELGTVVGSYAVQ